MSNFSRFMKNNKIAKENTTFPATKSLVDENGETHRMGVCKGKVKNSVGAGDSMVAGFIAGYLKNGDYEEALELGTASGGATAFSDSLATKDFIYENLRNLRGNK